MSKFLLEIITPLRVAFSDQVEMVVAPSAVGVIGILAHHVPLFTRLVEGELKIVKDGEEFFLAIGGGFMEVTKDRVNVLAARAVHAHELNEAEIRQAQERAQQALSGQAGSVDLEAKTLMRRSLLEMKVLHRRRAKTRLIS